MVEAASSEEMLGLSDRDCSSQLGGLEQIVDLSGHHKVGTSVVLIHRAIWNVDDRMYVVCLTEFCSLKVNCVLLSRRGIRAGSHSCPGKQPEHAICWLRKPRLRKAKLLAPRHTERK